MGETLSFPGLGLEFEINRVAFSIGSRPIYWYGIIIAFAFLAGSLYVMRRTKRFGLDADRVMDVILAGVLLGIIGARIYYVLFSWDTYKDDLVSILYIWKGGIAIYGGIIGALIAAVIVCKWRRVKLLPLLDLASGGLLLGQAIGRWGNFVNIEAFGSNTTAPWGMTSNTITWYLQQHKAELAAIGVTVDPQMPVHPTFFYESVWCLIGFILLAVYTRKRKFDGEMALMYLGWYGLGRFFIEGLRTDSLMVGSIRISQIVALLCLIASVVAIAIIRSKIRREGDPEYLKLYADTEEGQSVIAGTFYTKEAVSDNKAAKQEKCDAEESDATNDSDVSPEPDAPDEDEPDQHEEERDGGDTD